MDDGSRYFHIYLLILLLFGKILQFLIVIITLYILLLQQLVTAVLFFIDFGKNWKRASQRILM